MEITLHQEFSYTPWLKGEVVATASTKVGSGSGRGYRGGRSTGIGGCRSWGTHGSSRSRSRRTHAHSVRVYRLGFPAIDVGEPTAIILMAVDVEAQANGLSHFERELIGTVAKEAKEDFLGIGFLGFEHIFLLTPTVTSFRHATLGRKFLYYFSYCFHYISVVNLIILNSKKLSSNKITKSF